jgi:predicted Rossmann fold flavoprotein
VLEPETGKLFPASNRARDVRDALVEHALALGVRFRFDTAVTALDASAGGWTIRTTARTGAGETAVDVTRVVVATGGLSVPATGSDGGGVRLLEALGHRVHPVYAALTPLIADPPRHAALSGVSLDVRLRGRAGAATGEAHGGFLFTHRGYSGPSVLDISHLATRNRDAVLRVQWSGASAVEWEQMLTSGKAPVTSVVASRLPQRVAIQLVAEAGVPSSRRLTDLRRRERTMLVELLTSYVLPWTGHEGFKKAEVTGGGVALEDVDPKTLESRHHRGLFLCGELLDAFGPIGGHNFAWAWATGRLAGSAAGLP